MKGPLTLISLGTVTLVLVCAHGCLPDLPGSYGGTHKPSGGSYGGSWGDDYDASTDYSDAGSDAVDAGYYDAGGSPSDGASQSGDPSDGQNQGDAQYQVDDPNPADQSGSSGSDTGGGAEPANNPDEGGSDCTEEGGPVDYCAEYGYYGDGVCDTGCLYVDPDC